MNSAKLQEVRQELVEKQKRLFEDINRIEDARVQKSSVPGAVSNVPTHAADQDAEGLRTEITLNETLREEFDAVSAALNRLDKGEYGTCTGCGTEISDARLEALPETDLCIECERAAEEAGQR